MIAKKAGQEFKRSISLWYRPYQQDFLHAAHTISQILSQAGEATNIGAEQELLDRLSDVAKSFIETHPIVAGSGVILLSSLVTEPHSVLQWWLRDPDKGVVPGESDLDVDGTVLNDYEKQPWFTKALESGRPTLIGPYIDYLGMREYILTLSVPVKFSTEDAGIFGTDIRVRDLEGVVMPALRSFPADAALLNSQGRVIVGNSARFLVGDRVKEPPPHATIIALDPIELGLQLVFDER